MIPQETIRELYDAFSSEPKPSFIPTSMFGIDQEEGAKLVQIPLRELRWEDLDPYIRHIFHSCGSPADFRYLLPRILDLLPRDQGMTWSCRVGLCLSELPWSSLSVDQQAAISNFFFAHVDELLARKSVSGSELDSLLCSMSQFLPNWDLALSKVATSPAALRELLRWNVREQRAGFGTEGFWAESPKQEEFLAWMRSEETQIKAWSA